jgi:ABC-2 type transport system permease protein
VSPSRLGASFGVEFWHSFRRPLYIMMAILLALVAFGLSSGHMSISSGDSSVGGTKAWITSEFAQTQTMTYLTLLIYAFFIATAAGLCLLRDRETQVDVLLHATPLKPSEYVWGRFLAVIGAFLVFMVFQAFANAFFNHLVPNAGATDIRGPFSLTAYLRPVLMIGLPFAIFYAGLSMYIGEKSRNPVLVFVLPVATLLISGFFLWTWSPSWLSLGLNRVLQVVEPAGFRWLNETYLDVDRGVEFYNQARVHYDQLFWLNRAWLIGLGLGAVFLTQAKVAASMRGPVAAQKGWWQRKRHGAADTPEWAEASAGAIRALAMQSEAPSFVSSVRAVLRAELRELRHQAGLYIFVPLILIQCLGNALLAVGAFDTPLLLTPGITAVAVANQSTTLVCLLLMFYIVESLERERATGFAQILFSAPLKTSAFLFGKVVANSLVAVIVLLATLLACVIAMAIQHTVAFSLVPYVLVWGLCLVPTFFAWSAFVALMYAITGNRYGAYGLGLGALAFTGFRALTQKLSWIGNWPLWGAIRWSDLGFFETDRMALVLNRLMVLGFGVLFGVLAVKLFRRRGADAVRTMHRLAPGRLASSTAKILPWATVPLALLLVLVFQVYGGLEGGKVKKETKDYWAKNLKTWLDAPLPDIDRMDLEVKLDPGKHWISSQGSFTLVNPLDTTLAQVPLTTGLFWRNVSWTMNGEPCTPEDSQHLMVFTPPKPLAKGDRVMIGWTYDGRFPGGPTKNGGPTEEFILPSGVVLTGFQPSFAPVLGYMEQIGETKENHTEARRYSRDFWKGITRAGYGATAWFPARISVTAPEAYALNSVGVCVSDSVTDGWRTQVWETDHPVKIVNIVAGHWKTKRGQNDTEIFYSDRHPYNVDEMSSTLDAARQWFSEWFYPYPWKELKLSEFPALASYAQGFGTNITFSENIGFLTRNNAKTDPTFLVTAHETAHQWWGNILTPANGPGGDFLSEGMAHFSTMLLFQQVKGPRGRMEFAKGIEDRYSRRRRPNEERPMYDVDSKRPSDTTVIYDRGGWVFWMLYDFLGADRALPAYRNFFDTWRDSRDHPALQDFVAAMRPYAADTTAYDAFTKEWFEDKVVPQYTVTQASRKEAGQGFEVTATVTNIGTGTMPVDVAATAGERWKKAEKGKSDSAYTSDPDYKDARNTITLAAGESKTVTIHCDFKPEHVVVDPDVRVLQLKRKQAVASL